MDGVGLDWPLPFVPWPDPFGFDPAVPVPFVFEPFELVPVELAFEELVPPVPLLLLALELCLGFAALLLFVLFPLCDPDCPALWAEPVEFPDPADPDPDPDPPPDPVCANPSAVSGMDTPAKINV